MHVEWYLSIWAQHQNFLDSTSYCALSQHCLDDRRAQFISISRFSPLIRCCLAIKALSGQVKESGTWCRPSPTSSPHCDYKPSIADKLKTACSFSISSELHLRFCCQRPSYISTYQAGSTMSIRIPTPIVPVCEKDQPLFKSVNAFVHGYMSQPGHDNSHDYDHILRVVSNANRLLETELKSNPSQTYDITALFLAALLHDVGDHKYAKPGEDLENQISALLKERGASDELATKVQVMVKNVSYSNESKHPESVVDVLCKYPELAIVQDSDRLDAIGAVGVGRCFAYTGAKCQGEPMSRAIDHFSEKLYKLAGMMKTVSGRELAASRTKLLQQFAEEFNKEAGLSFALE